MNNILNWFGSKTKDYFILLLVLFAGYSYLFVYANQFDFIDCWLPWRHFISKSFHNGIFPLWNPFQQLGYPIYADLAGPSLSVENYITGNILNINLSNLQLILFCLFIHWHYWILRTRNLFL